MATYDDSRFTYDDSTYNIDYDGKFHPAALTGAQDPASAGLTDHGHYFRTVTGAQPTADPVLYDDPDGTYDDPVLVYDQGSRAFILWHGHYHRTTTGISNSGSGDLTRKWVDRPEATYEFSITDLPESRTYVAQEQGLVQRGLAYQDGIEQAQHENVYRDPGVRVYTTETPS